MDHYEHLLQQFRSLWSGRKLDSGEDSEQTLKEAMKSELLDEYTHPRLRRSLHEKFYLAVERILQSALPAGDKLALIQMYKDVAETIKKQ